MQFLRLSWHACVFAFATGISVAGAVAADAACGDRFKMIAWPGGSLPNEALVLEHFAGGDVILTGAQVIKAQPSTDQHNRPVVAFRMSAEGARLFGEYTAAHIGEPIAIVFDDRLYSTPFIREAIFGGSGMVSGLKSVAEAQDMAVAIASQACADAPKKDPATGS
ncbi:hypothetical protein N4R57_07150 [Rhodobacteraceae bacterium D3-12]|nr:hypothetical protein N4R57_07150 [Rhodobacteraceae bacterium D3-12]